MLVVSVLCCFDLWGHLLAHSNMIGLSLKHHIWICSNCKRRWGQKHTSPLWPLNPWNDRRPDKVETEAAVHWDRKCSDQTQQICWICTEQTSKSVSVNVVSYTWTGTQWAFHFRQSWVLLAGCCGVLIWFSGSGGYLSFAETWRGVTFMKNIGISNARWVFKSPSCSDTQCSSFLCILKWMKKTTRVWTELMNPDVPFCFKAVHRFFQFGFVPTLHWRKEEHFLFEVTVQLKIKFSEGKVVKQKLITVHNFML